MCAPALNSGESSYRAGRVRSWIRQNSAFDRKGRSAGRNLLHGGM